MRRCLLLLLLLFPLAARAQQAPSFSVMLWTLPGSNFDTKLRTVAAAGYHHVELVDEYQLWDEPAWQHALATLHSLGLSVDAIGGIRAGFADPGARTAFLSQLRTAIAAAQRLSSSPQIILLSGPILSTLTPAQQHAAALETLCQAAPLLASAHLTGVIEPIDRLENPTIYLDSVEEGFALAEEVHDPHLLVLYDLYHQQRGHGNLTENLEKHLALTGLIHIADTPGRHAPGTGEISYAAIYRTLARLGYSRTLAMEFLPTADPVAELRTAREQAEAAMSAGPTTPRAAPR